MGLYQVSSSNSPGVKFEKPPLPPGGYKFYMGLYREKL